MDDYIKRIQNMDDFNKLYRELKMLNRLIQEHEGKDLKELKRKKKLVEERLDELMYAVKP